MGNHGMAGLAGKSCIVTQRASTSAGKKLSPGDKEERGAIDRERERERVRERGGTYQGAINPAEDVVDGTFLVRFYRKRDGDREEELSRHPQYQGRGESILK